MGSGQPPLTVYLYGLLDGAYIAVAHLFTPQPTLSVAASPLLAVYMKLPVCAADLALVGIIYTQARRLRSRRWATIAAASYAFSPTVLFDGALWGQSDALSLLAIVVALLYTLRHRGVPAGVLFAAAVLFKPQPFVFGPLILFYLWRWAGGREALRALAAMAGTGLALCLPFLLPPHPEILVFLRTARAVALVRPFATLDGYNVWWFMGDMRTNVARPLVGPLSATVIGWLLFALVALVVAIGLWRDPSGTRLFLGAALLATAFFDVTTLQRDRYLFPALALFLLATIGDCFPEYGDGGAGEREPSSGRHPLRPRHQPQRAIGVLRPSRPADTGGRRGERLVAHHGRLYLPAQPRGAPGGACGGEPPPCRWDAD